MLRRISILHCALFLLLPSLSHADSPLTSTPFSSAYMDISMVKYAAEKGVMDKKIAKFLLSTNTPDDEKAAVVNALSWAYEGKDNATLFMGFLRKKYKGKVSMEEYSLLSASEKMCLGYMLALDDYFNPKRALPYLEAAAKELKTSYTCHMLLGLVKAQIVFDENFCHVWKTMNTIDTDVSLNMDLRSEAREIVMEYIALYKADC